MKFLLLVSLLRVTSTSNLRLKLVLQNQSTWFLLVNNVFHYFGWVGFCNYHIITSLIQLSYDLITLCTNILAKSRLPFSVWCPLKGHTNLQLHAISITTWKFSVFGVFLAHIFPHLNWIRSVTPYLFVFSPNMGKDGPEKLQIQMLFTQCMYELLVDTRHQPVKRFLEILWKFTWVTSF